LLNIFAVVGMLKKTLASLIC